MAGSRENPVQLDPFQNIVNVGWRRPTGSVAVGFRIQRNDIALPTLMLSGLPFTTTQYNLMSPAAFDERDGDGNIRMWKPATRVVSTSSPSATGNGWLFFDLRYIRASLSPGNPFTFKLTTPPAGGSRIVPGEVGELYHVWYDFGDPFPGSPPFEYAANVSWAGAGDLAYATALAAELSVHSSYSVHVQSGVSEPRTINETMEIDIDVYSYRDRFLFPLDSNNDPLWPSTEHVDVERTDIDGTASGPKPSYLITHSVNLRTLDITKTQV